ELDACERLVRCEAGLHPAVERFRELAAEGVHRCGDALGGRHGVTDLRHRQPADGRQCLAVRGLEPAAHEQDEQREDDQEKRQLLHSASPTRRGESSEIWGAFPWKASESMALLEQFPELRSCEVTLLRTTMVV